MSTSRHPKGLYLIFATSTAERFSYYGMRAIFILFLTQALLFDKEHAASIYGSYTGLVYLTPLIGGYIADKYDEDADTCQARAHSRMQNSVSSELSASITGYNSVSTLSENISIDYTAKHYALLPVWMLHTKWQGKDYLFAMNGQTGKLVGDLPVDKRKVAAWFAGISVPLMILLAILL